MPELPTGVKPGYVSPYTVIPCPKGTRNWGLMPVEIETETDGDVKSGPIRLFHGKHDGPNRGFGKTHIYAEHQDEFRICGFDAFVTDAISTFNCIYRQDDKIIIVFKTGMGRLQAVLEYRSYKEDFFYSIVTAFRPTPLKKIKGDEIWKKKG